MILVYKIKLNQYICEHKYKMFSNTLFITTMKAQNQTGEANEANLKSQTLYLPM